jgi:diguanylate cyclase (GGDEF)-like protein/PAS domain S-box-containing protein
VKRVSDRQSKGKLRQQKILLDTALENMSQGLCMFDADGNMTLFNERYAKMMGMSAAWLKGRSLLDLFKRRKASGEFVGDPEGLSRAWSRTRAKVNSTPGSCRHRAGGRSVWSTNLCGGGGWVATFEDVTEWRKAQAQISYMAHHDALTGLANRTQLVKLEKGLAVLPLKGGSVAVHFIDLDRFKKVNDTLGHEGGDFLLKTAAERRRSVTRVNDVVARLGGDEFVVVQIGVGSKDQAEDLASRFTSPVTAPMKFREQSIIATMSVGVALAPADGNEFPANPYCCQNKEPGTFLRALKAIWRASSPYPGLV